MKPPTVTFKKFLLPSILLVIVIVGGFFIWRTKSVSNQQAALYNTQTTQFACQIQIGSNGMPLPQTPTIGVLSPNGGETYTAGQSITVKWGKCGIPATQSMRIELTYQVPGGVSGSVVLLNSTPNDGTELVTLPTPGTGTLASVPFGAYYKVKVWTIVGSAVVQDISNNVFNIYAPLVCSNGGTPQIHIISPNGGEVYQEGQSLNVRWDSCNFDPNWKIVIVLVANMPNGGQYFKTIGGTWPNTGQATIGLNYINALWGTIGNHFRIQLVVNVKDPVTGMWTIPTGAQDYSDTTFTIN